MKTINFTLDSLTFCVSYFRDLYNKQSLCTESCSFCILWLLIVVLDLLFFLSLFLSDMNINKILFMMYNTLLLNFQLTFWSNIYETLFIRIRLWFSLESIKFHYRSLRFIRKFVKDDWKKEYFGIRKDHNNGYLCIMSVLRQQV